MAYSRVGHRIPPLLSPALLRGTARAHRFSLATSPHAGRRWAALECPCVSASRIYLIEPRVRTVGSGVRYVVPFGVTSRTGTAG